MISVEEDEYIEYHDGKYRVEVEIPPKKAGELRETTLSGDGIEVERRADGIYLVAETTDVEAAQGYAVMFRKALGQ